MRWPEGLSSAGVTCGIKSSGEPDLGLLVSERPLQWAGTFTRNSAAAPCVAWNRARLWSPVRAVVVNSGNANACTGVTGTKAVSATADAAAAQLGCDATEVLVCSTGVIGVQLDTSLIERALPHARRELSPQATGFARAISASNS